MVRPIRMIVMILWVVLVLVAKSPFAYTKSFSTTSYYNGKAYNYIAAMDEGGVPSLNLFGVTDTNEPNGLEISLSQLNSMTLLNSVIRVREFSTTLR
jgi:hypothetical protein